MDNKNERKEEKSNCRKDENSMPPYWRLLVYEPLPRICRCVPQEVGET